MAREKVKLLKNISHLSLQIDWEKDYYYVHVTWSAELSRKLIATIPVPSIMETLIKLIFLEQRSSLLDSFSSTWESYY